MLANVRDPGNAGTVLRTADAAGADAVIFADASVDLYNGKCVRASRGQPVPPAGRGRRAGLPETIATLQEAGLRVLAADGRAGVTLDDPATRAALSAPDRVAVRQRGVGTARRPAGARGRVGRGPDLRPRGVAQPRLRRGGVPVRLGLRAAGHVRLIRPARDAREHIASYYDYIALHPLKAAGKSPWHWVFTL